MMVRWCAATATALAACVVMIACGAGDAKPGGPTIAIFTKNQANPYFQSIRTGADNAAQQLGATVVHYVPTRADSIPEQMSQIEDAIIRKPDAAVFIPVDATAMVPGIDKLNAAGIPVVNVTDKATGGQFISFVGCDEYHIALSTGRYLLTAMKGQGNVVVIDGVRGSTNSTTRMRGYNDALKEFPGIKVLATQPGNFQRLQALQVMENMLQSYHQLDGVLALNDAMAMGAIEALEAANRKALVVGINGTKEAVDAVVAGRLLATGDCDGFLHGCFGVMAAAHHLKKETIPASIEFPVVVVDKSNASSSGVLEANRMCPAWERFARVGQPR